MIDNLPNLQPGTKIIVRHRANGDTEYICRPDEHTILSVGESSTFLRIILLIIMVVIMWRILPESAAEKSRRLPSSDKTEVADR